MLACMYRCDKVVEKLLLHSQALDINDTNWVSNMIIMTVV